jgi:hypothetical protein
MIERNSYYLVDPIISGIQSGRAGAEATEIRVLTTILKEITAQCTKTSVLPVIRFFVIHFAQHVV